MQPLRKTIYIFAALTCLLSTFLLYSQQLNIETSKEVPTPVRETPTPVKALAPTIIEKSDESALDTSEEYRVVLEPYYRTSLLPEVLQPVQKINYRMGDRFKKGDVLLQLDSDVLEANKKKAQALVERTRTEYVAKKELYNDHVASLFEVKEAEANVAAAEADLALATKNLRSAVLVAPYDGKVVELGIEEYELPQQGKPLIQILDDRILRARLLLPSSVFLQVHVGDPITIHVVELGKTFTGKITRISAALDPASSTFKIEAEIDNSQGDLRAGMVGLTKLGSIIHGTAKDG